jgi:UDP-N-acetylglucosamine transferase subunit ALG13
MIFVTLGTHGQPFDRLVKKVDQLAEKKSIADEVFIQIGPNYNYVPRFCHYKEFISFQEMESRLKEARIIIAHGGLGSIFQSLINNKVPIIVPRQKKYSEHVDDHQLLFSKKI